MISKMCFRKKNLLALLKVAKVTEGDKKMAVYYAKFKKKMKYSTFQRPPKLAVKPDQWIFSKITFMISEQSIE